MSIWHKVAFVFAAAWMSMMAAVSQLYSAEPVSFDVAANIAVHEISAPEISTRYPAEKVIAIQAKVSIYLDPQHSARLEEVVITLESPAVDFSVVDFFPKTQLDTSFASPVSVNHQHNHHEELNFDAAGYYKTLTGATLNGAYLDKSALQAQFQLLPPRELVLASGTIQRGRGVYFKLKANSQHTLEGEKNFLVFARVPRSWRGDVLRVSGEAHGNTSSFLSALEEHRVVARQDFLVALYASGDAAARERAEQFTFRQHQLLQVVVREQRQIERNTTPKMLRKMGISASTLSPAWLKQWIFTPAQASLIEKFPADVREAAWSFARARAALHELNGASATRVAKHQTATS
jgi:hypothetical protein